MTGFDVARTDSEAELVPLLIADVSIADRMRRQLRTTHHRGDLCRAEDDPGTFYRYDQTVRLQLSLKNPFHVQKGHGRRKDSRSAAGVMSRANRDPTPSLRRVQRDEER